MKNKPIRQEELLELGHKLNYWIEKKLNFWTEKLNRKFSSQTKYWMIVGLLFLLFLLNILSFVLF